MLFWNFKSIKRYEGTIFTARHGRAGGGGGLPRDLFRLDHDGAEDEGVREAHSCVLPHGEGGVPELGDGMPGVGIEDTGDRAGRRGDSLRLHVHGERERGLPRGGETGVA